MSPKKKVYSSFFKPPRLRPRGRMCPHAVCVLTRNPRPAPNACPSGGYWFRKVLRRAHCKGYLQKPPLRFDARPGGASAGVASFRRPKYNGAAATGFEGRGQFLRGRWQYFLRHSGGPARSVLFRRKPPVLNSGSGIPFGIIRAERSTEV